MNSQPTAITEPLDGIASLIAEHQGKGAMPLLIAIDGAGGAGKSSLARWIRDGLSDVSIVEMDDFYCPTDDWIRRTWSPEEGYQNFFDWMGLRDHVLEPLRNKVSPRFQAFDWMRNQLNGWKQVPLNPIIIVEGVYALRPELRSFYHLRLFVEAPVDIRTARLRARGDSEQDIQMWQAAESWYLTNVRPQDNCDLILPGH